MFPPLIRFENISVKFKDSYIFNNFNLSIFPKDKVLLYGKSGTGKSTLFKLLLGFLQAEKGRVLFEEKPLDKSFIWEIRKEIAYVSQDLELGDYEVQSFFDTVLAYRNNTGQDFATRIPELLTFFELHSEITEKNISELSGGEKQRIAIITAALLQRKIFLLDEITSALDEKMNLKVIQFFADFSDSTIVIISHDKSWHALPGLRVIDLEGITTDNTSAP